MHTIETLVARAWEIAREAHAAHKDKAGAPYIGHIERVAKNFGPNDPGLIIAILHDLIEDCPEWSSAKLLAEGFPPEIVDSIVAITKLPEEKPEGKCYDRYIERVANDAWARRVKMFDYIDNLDITRFPAEAIGERERARVPKYLRALRCLIFAEARDAEQRVLAAMQARVVQMMIGDDAEDEGKGRLN